MTRRSARRLGRGLLFVLGALAFSSAIGNRLELLDDARIILGQPFLRAVTLRNLVTCVWPLNPVREEWLPLRDLTLMADFALHGGRPEGFVVTNLLLHGAVTVAVLGLLRRALRGTPEREVAALAGATLFAVHPIHLESVAWASGRKDSLVALCVVLAASRWLDAGRTARREQERRRRLQALALGAAALLCKASAVCAPLLLVAADLLVVRPAPGRAWARRLLWLAPLGVTSALFARGYTRLLAEFARLSGDVVVKQFPGDPLVTIACTDAHVLRQYLQRLVVPLDLQPFSDQGYRTGLDGEVALGLLVCAAAVVGAVALLRRRPGLQWLAAWSALAMTPFLNLVPHGIPYAERYTHLASVGACGLLGVVVARCGAILSRGRRRDLTRVTGLILAPLAGLLTFACLTEARSFKSAETLWTRVLRADPDNAFAAAALGRALLDREPERAAKLLERALAKDPGRYTAAHDLALLAERAGRLDEALARYRDAARARPSHVGSLVGAARVLAKQGRWEAAVALHEEVMTRWPEAAARAAWDRASTLEQAGQQDAARLAWRQYLERWGQRPGEERWAAEARARLAR